ncbi:50S ribosomal protein L6, partial [Patescibacteria group bacterium]|nr:50S ribosomal protein L6 [Patescibacteria group bacterium]
MSRLAKKPIAYANSVQVTSADGILTVKGPKETLTRSVHPSVSITVEPEGVVITPVNSSKLAKALTGTFAAHVRAMVDGVVTPFKKVLQFNGV